MSSVNVKEIAHFSKDAPQWWNEDGPFAPLHRLNPARLSYIKEQVLDHYSAIKKLSVLDIGCGGGLICEPLSRLEAKVTGIDADPEAILAAKQHATEEGLQITYQNSSIESLLKSSKQRYDVVLALEIVEHVDDIQNFVQSCFEACKPGGLVIFSTLNRTAKSFLLGIIAAEYLLRWVPKGTHQWSKFVKPSQLHRYIRQAGGTYKDQKGLYYNPIEKEFKVSNKDTDVNYFITSEKRK